MRSLPASHADRGARVITFIRCARACEVRRETPCELRIRCSRGPEGKSLKFADSIPAAILDRL